MRLALDGGDAEIERLVEERSVRLVLAASREGAAAVTWIQRALDTGRSEYWLLWRGERRRVASLLVQSPVALAIGPTGPALLLVERSGGEARLTLHPWAGEVAVVWTTDRDLAGPSLLFDSDGGAVVAWLEGEVVRTEFGVESDWDAFAAYSAADGATGGVTELGEAANDGVQFSTRVDWPAEGPQVAWTAPGGALMVARPDEAAFEVGRGHPIGAHGGAFYWFDGTAIQRLPIGELGGDLEPERVVWSPNVPERIQAGAHGDHLHIVWYGARVGGGFEVFGASDREAIRLGPLDRIAGLMGWSPWDFWQSLTGQTLVSLLIGLLATMALSPLLLLSAILVSRAIPADRGTPAGLVLGAVGVAALVAAFALFGVDLDIGALFGTWELALAVAVGGASAWLLRRSADSETVFAIVSSAGISTTVALSLIGFIHFRSWSALWGGLL